MPARTLLFVCLSLLLLGCAAEATGAGETATERPEITLVTAGTPAGTVYLIANIGDQKLIQDSTRVATAGGAAVFNRQRPYPRGLYFAYYPDKTAVQLMIDQDQQFTIRTDKNDLVNATTVNGSRANELFYDNRRFEAELQPRLREANSRLDGLTEGSPDHAATKAERDELLAQRKAYLDKMFADHPDNFYVTFKRAGQNPEVREDLVKADGSPDNAARLEAYRKDFWSNVDFTDTALLRTPVIYNKLKRYMEDLSGRNAAAKIESADYLIRQIIDQPEYLRYFANWITLQYEPGKTNLMDGEAVYVHMIQNYFTPELAFWSDSMNIYGLQQRAREMSKSLIGQPGPNLTVPDLNGQPKTLYDLPQPYLIVYLYNPTCDHCIEQTPKVLDFIRSRPPGEIGLYAIAVDTEPAPWREFINQYGLGNHTNVFDPSNRAIYGTYYVDHTPELYVLGPDRTIIGKNLKAGQVGAIIDRDKNSR